MKAGRFPGFGDHVPFSLPPLFGPVRAGLFFISIREVENITRMSVFGIIRKGRQAAKDLNAKQAEKEKKEQEKPPYKHVPRHAAIDALSGGPAGYRTPTGLRIQEQNRRRSAMTASGVGMSGMNMSGMNMSGVMTPVHLGVPRINSSLSHVSYPSAYASPVVQVPRSCQL